MISTRRSLFSLLIEKSLSQNKISKKSLKSLSSKNPFKSNYQTLKKENLINAYEKYKSICETLDNKKHIDPKGVFCNNEIDLKDIEVYGFDYDYTLAYYNVSLYRLIFNMARDTLVNTFKYPEGLRSLEYLPHFPIRGLHFDKRKGWLMKIDSYHNIQKGTVYHGMNPVDDENVVKFFGGYRLNIQDIGHTQSSPNFHHFVDLFCLPEICLVACTFQYFLDKNIHYTPEYIFQDVHEAVSSLHRDQLLHKSIVQSIDDFLLPIEDENNPVASSSIYVKELLYRLNKSNKKVFLITNSPYWFVNFGMESLCGADWTNLFDLIICNANKPYFFSSKSKPFRKFNLRTNSKSWENVSSLSKGNIYYEGNVFDMLAMTKWPSNTVLYFGDHIYGDLAEPFLKYGWRTAAILNEVEYEVQTINKIEYQRTIMWLKIIEELIQKSKFVEDDHNLIPYDPANVSSPLHSLTLHELRNLWLDERSSLMKNAKESFNPYFGSVFRTSNNPSFFSRRLSRFADIYTSNVTNLLNYPVNAHFIPRRVELAHELAAHVDIDF